jgi:hypothetical protein
VASKSQTAARRHVTSGLRREVHVQLDNARFGFELRREPVQARRTYGGVHVTTHSR